MASKDPSINHQDLTEISKTLLSEDCHPRAVARDWQSKYQYVDGALDTLCRATMAFGQIELAECLLGMGADPQKARPKLLNIYGLNWYHLDPLPSVLHSLASQATEHIVRLDAPSSSKRRPRVEVLAYMMANQEIWPTVVNDVYYGNTPLTASQKAGNSNYLWSRKGSGKQSDLVERRAFQEMLIQYGAEINPQNTRNNLLESSIPDFNHELDNFSELDRVIALGVDTHAHAPSAWVRAMIQDVSLRYPKKALYGPRAQALIDRCIPLHSPVDAPDDQSPLSYAVYLGLRPAVEQLIRDGVDPCWRNPQNGSTLLMENADPKGNTLAMLKLFPKGSFATIVNAKRLYDGDTALHVAVNSLSAPMVEFILSEGADIHAVNNKNQKVLQSIRRSGNQAQDKFDDVLAILMEYGVDVGADKHSSAMHQAAKLLSAKTIQHLLGQGYDPHGLDRHKSTPIELVLQGHQRHDGARFNVGRGIKQIEAIDAFIGAGVDIKKPLHDGRTLLHEAVARGCHIAAIHLLKCGADPHAVYGNGDTPMHVMDKDRHGDIDPAKERYITEMIDAFITAGADIDRVNNSGKLSFQEARGLRGVQACLEGAALRRTTPDLPPSLPRRRMRL